MSKLTIVLNNKCCFCQSFCEQYKNWIEEKNVKVIVTPDLTDYAVRDLLDVLEINELPAVILTNKIAYTGINAFNKMHELTGVEGECTKGGNTTKILAHDQCITKVLHTIGVK